MAECLISINNKGETLYAIAYENWKTRKTGFIYMHALDIGDAVKKILVAKKGFDINTRIVSMAPAVGALERVKKKIRVFGGL
jgi:hypothetical protein